MSQRSTTRPIARGLCASMGPRWERANTRGACEVLAARSAATVTAAAVRSWLQPRTAGAALSRKPEATGVMGTVSQGKNLSRPHRDSIQRSNHTTVLRWRYVEALRRPNRPLVVFDEASTVEPSDLLVLTGRPIDPFTCAVAPVASFTSGQGW